MPSEQLKPTVRERSNNVQIRFPCTLSLFLSKHAHVFKSQSKGLHHWPKIMKGTSVIIKVSFCFRSVLDMFNTRLYYCNLWKSLQLFCQGRKSWMEIWFSLRYLFLTVFLSLLMSFFLSLLILFKLVGFGGSLVNFQ